MIKGHIIIGVLIVLVGFVSCSQKMAKPDNLIPEETMIKVLTDLTLLNASEVTEKKTLNQYNITPETYIYKKYNIDSLQFAVSNTYYANNVDAYQRIYNKLKEELNAKKLAFKKLEKEELKEKKKQDSIRRAKVNLNPKDLKNSKTKKKKELKGPGETIE